MKTLKILISVDITTDKEIEKVTSAIKRGIYRGLDIDGNYIAPPKDVQFNYCGERKEHFK